MEAPLIGKIHDTAPILEPDMLDLGENVHIMDYAVVGLPNPDNDLFENESQRRIRIGENSTIYPMSVIYEGATLGAGVVMAERTTVGSLTVIKDRVRILYHAQIHDRVRVGADSVIGGFTAGNVTIGSRCSVFGSLVHRYVNNDPRSWDDVDELGQTLGDDVLVAWGAVIIGDVRIGWGAHIYPNCVVTRDVAEEEKFSGR